MATNKRKFEFDGKSEDGRIKGKDRDDYPVEFEIGRDIAKKHELKEGWKAGWEDIVGPILVKKAKDEADPYGDNMRTVCSFDEAAELLTEAIKDDIEAGAVTNVEEVAETKDPERYARFLLEYLADQGILSMENGDVVVFEDPDDELAEGGLAGAGDDTVDYFLTWTGYLDRLGEETSKLYEMVEKNVGKMEQQLDKLEDENKKLKKEIQDARQELFNLTGGEMIKPKEMHPDGRAKQAPDEVDDKRRYKVLYNRIVSRRNQLHHINFEEAREELTQFMEEAKETEKDIERQVDRLRMYVGVIESLPNPEEVLPERFFGNIVDSQMALQQSMMDFMSTTEQASKMTAEAVFGVDEGETEVELQDTIEPARLEEAKQIDEEQEEIAEEALTEAGKDQDLIANESGQQ